MNVCAVMNISKDTDKYGNQSEWTADASMGCIEVWPMCNFDAGSVTIGDYVIVDDTFDL